MIPKDEDFRGTWPFAPHFFDGHGFRQHYVDEGEGDPIVLLHGEPTWGYLYREFIPPLSRTHRVVVPDHMGFGKSETPQDREYTLSTHVENLVALVEHLDLNAITLVLQDWGGPMGTQLTVRHPQRVKRLVFMNTVNGYGRAHGRADLPDPMQTPWFKWIGEGYESGRTEAVLTHLGSTVLSVMKLVGLKKTRVINDTWVRAYAAPFPTPESCKGALEFPLDAYLGRINDYVREGVMGLADLKAKPAMLAMGMADCAIWPEVALADFKGTWPDGPTVELPRVGHYCQEDAPEILIPLIQQFIQLT